MSATIEKIKLEKEIIMDDITENKSELNIDEDKLAKLRAKLLNKQKETEMTANHNNVAKRDKSIKFGVVGSGQAGSRIAETFYKLGYDAVCINLAQQDLKFISIPESNKLHLNWGLGGAAKDLSIGKAAAEQYKPQIAGLVSAQLADAQVLILALSLGGGSGAGSCETLVDVLTATGKPVCVITALPMDSDGQQTKANALQTLSKLSRYAQSKKISNLIVVDNAKIEAVYSGVSQIDFFDIANSAIVEPIDLFNTVSSLPSSSKPFDPMEWAKLITDGSGLTTYGTIKVHNYQEEDSLASAVIENLNTNLLAGGFDLKQSKYVGIVIAANANVWKSISASSVNYSLSLVEDQCGTPVDVFRGVYVIDSPEDCVMIYSIFSGLGLPTARVEQLKKETEKMANTTKTKEDNRHTTLHLDTGTDQAVSKVQEIKNRVAAKSSAFGKLLSNNVIDRRK